MSLLEVDALEAGYDDALVLRGVTLRADAHEIVAVIGPNGAGKSTLLKAVYGLVTLRAGTVKLDGGDGARLRQAARDQPARSRDRDRGAERSPRACARPPWLRARRRQERDRGRRRRPAPRPAGRAALPGRLRDYRVELDLDQHSLGDKSGDEVGRVRGLDARERLPVGAHGGLPVAPVGKQHAGTQDVL